MLRRKSASAMAATVVGVAVAAMTLAVPGGGAGAATAPKAARPFPHHVTYRTGVLPSVSQSARDAAVRKHYDSWKAKYLRAACGGYLVYATGDAPNKGTVSEAQGYGMNIVPLMAGYDAGAKAEFDGLWRVVTSHLDRKGLMKWKLDGRSCRYADSGTPDSATDGDLDVGYGLLLADRQWGGYRSAALNWLGKVYAHDVAPSGYLRIADDQEEQPDNIVGYNSVRVPWHLGTDALLYGSPVSLAAAKKESASYESHAGGNPAKIYPHTKLDGTPVQKDDRCECANNPVGVAAMAAGDRAWTDALWRYLAGNPFDDTYYGETVKMLVYLVMAGDYWSP